MTPIGPGADGRLAVAVVLLVALAAAAARLGGLPLASRSVRASARAAVQLGVVAVVITAALEHTWSALAFVAVMAAVATGTSAGRLGARTRWPWILLALSAGQAPVLAAIFATGSTPLSPPAIVAICGIVIGGTMTACTLATRRALADLQAGRGQVEAALALGLSRAAAIRLVVDPAAPEALVPVLDQTRTVGLVTLPGAFVGVLLGGGSPVEAAAAQLVVLVGLVAGETLTVVAATRLVAAGRLLPDEVLSQLPVG